MTAFANSSPKSRTVRPISGIVKYVYVALTLLSMIVAGATNLTFLQLAPAIVFMWVCYFAFFAGEISVKQGGMLVDSVRTKELAAFWWIASAACCAICAVLAAEYYTGRNVALVWEALVTGESLYASYQSHFVLDGIATAGLMKVPYVLMLAVVKTCLFVGVLSVLTRRRMVRWFHIAFVASAVLSHLYVGIARGTNFEVFEIVVLFSYATYMRMGSLRISGRSLLLVAGLATGALWIFYTSIAMRGFVFPQQVSAEVQFDSSSFLSQVAPFVAFLGTSLFGYFGFGIFYVSHWISFEWLQAPVNVVAGLLPGGFRLMSGRSIVDHMGTEINVGVRWHPDVALAIDYLGLFGLLALLLLLGRIAGKLAFDPEDWLPRTARFLIFFQMFSFPLGNFVGVSSSTLILIGCMVLVFVRRAFDRAISLPASRRVGA